MTQINRRDTARARLSVEIAKLKGLEAKLPLHHRQVLHEVIAELNRLHRDLAGISTVRLPEPRVQPGPLKASNRQRHAAKQHDGKRHCPMHAEGVGAWLAVSAFAVKNQSTGALRSWCKSCTKEYQRARYVAVKARSVAVTLVEGDQCVGRDCPCCGLMFEIGDRVEGENLQHEYCKRYGRGR